MNGSEKTDAGSGEGWHPGSFPRDTLIYTLGSLAASVLRRAVAEPEFTTRYRAWLDAVAATPLLADGAEPMLTTGIDDGVVTLLARPLEGEFCLSCEHTQFKALMAVAFDLARLDIEGVFVAQFEGEPVAAIRFAQLLMREVVRRPPGDELAIGERQTGESLKN